MKKEYVKPDVYFESFELSTGVAACAIQLNKDGSYKTYTGSNQDNLDMIQFDLSENGFAKPACEVDVESYSYFGGGESTWGS